MAIEWIHTYCAMCVSRCGVVATVSDGILTKVTPDPAHPNGCICVKGTAAPEIVYAPDRLRHPMVRTRPKSDPDPGWARISWDEALALTASRLLQIKARHGPEAVVFPIATPAGSAASDFMPWAVARRPTNRAIGLFYALTGQFDQRGSNVLFASTPANPITGHGLLPAGQAARRLGHAERPLGPAGVPGLVRASDVYRAILTGRPYPVRALVAFGTDPLLAHANPLLGKRALQELDFYVHTDLFANPSGSLADLLLPAASCWESQAIQPCPPPYALPEHTGTWAQFRPAVVPPVHQARPDLEIIFDLAQPLGLGDQFFGGDIEAAFNHHLAPSELTVQQLRDHPAGVRVPGQTRYRKYAEIDAQTGQPHGFQTPTRKLEIYSTSFARAGHPPLPVVWEAAAGCSKPGAKEDYPLTLTFARLVQDCDDGHRNLPRLRRQAPEPFLEIHPAAAAASGIEEGDWVVLETPAGGVTVKAKLNTSLNHNVVTTQYGWWQECQELAAPGYGSLCTSLPPRFV
jgi:anaerobic selenocysteine-containing dehydrogenase